MNREDTLDYIKSKGILPDKNFGQNFLCDEEIIEAINYAHLFNRKVYITLNTVIKEEFIQRTKSLGYITQWNILTLYV